MSSASRVWPSRDDYQNAVLHPQRNLKDPRLHSTQVETKLQMGVLKLPSPRSGNFGAVYKFSNQRQSYALKVFDKAQPDRQLRYRLINEHLDRQAQSPNLVSFSYDEQGILVTGRWYPALLMDWAEGQLLDDYLEETLKRRRGQADNHLLCQAWVDLMLGLTQRHIAHGDLQHGNILRMPDGTLKLVDYDGMFVPAMRQHDLTAAEIGLPAYQHPKRDRSYFDERLDNFAALVVFLSLACVDRDRWQHYHTDDNCLIVREPDLRRPEQSALLIELSQSPDAPVRKLAVLLKAAAQRSLDAIPAFAQVVMDGTIKQLLTSSWRPTPSPHNREEQKVRPVPPPNRKEQEGRDHLLEKLKERQVELTPRQRQLLAFLAQGYGDEQIAQALSIQKTTVSGHLSKLQQQAGVMTRKDLMVWAVTHGFGQTPLPPTPPPVKIEPPKPPPAVLTPGDKLVISYLAEGASDEQIAQSLSVETASVRAYISEIQRKVGATTRRDLMNWASANGIKPREPTPLVPVGEIRRFDDGHTHLVRNVAFSPDGRYALSGSFDSYICLWDANSGKEIRRFQGHGGWFSSGEVMSVGFAPDGQRIVSGSMDKTLRLWQVESGRELLRMKGHADAVMSVTFSPDGRHLASGSKDKTVRLWDAQTGQEIKRFEGHGDMVLSVAFSPDGRSILSGSGDKTIREWSVEGGYEINHSSGHVGMVCSVACSPDGYYILSGSADQTVRVWAKAAWREIRRFVGHKNAVMSVVFSPDGSRCLSASLDQTVHLWDVASGGEIDHVYFTKGGGPCWGVAFSPDGRCALYGYGGKREEGEEGWSPGDNNGVRLWGLPK